MPIWLIIAVSAAYMAGLFALAWRRDREAASPGFSQHPIIYALALAVYCTSWTYFGAVGTAASSGWDYLPIYLGPALVFLFLPGVVRRIGDIAQRESVTSLSDFLSARYGKSPAVAALATLAAVAGSLPYIALQLKSIGASFVAVTSTDPGAAVEPPNETLLMTAIVLAAFAILFGARDADATHRNAGLMRVLAVEAMVKLVALIAVCILSLTLLGASTPVIPNGDAAPADPFAGSSISGRFITITLLAMAAAICLPRQFHVAIIERRDADEVNTARWVFPLYLLATSVVVVPITLAGLSVLPAGSPPDLFVMALPLSQGDGLLATFVFLGGFSAATGMVIVSAIALSTMVTNDLLVPAMMRFRVFSTTASDVGARLTLMRRAVIAVLLLLAYGYYRLSAGGEALAQIGLLSFAAAIQFAPALIGGLYWKGARRDGALAGMGAGMAIWGYTLFLPAIAGEAVIAAAAPGWLHPHAIFGFDFGDSLTHGVAWSVAANIALFIIFSLRAQERLRDRIQAAAFVGDGARIGAGAPHAAETSGVTPDGLKALAARFLSVEAVDHAFDEFAADTAVATRGDGPADWRLVQRTERLLASALGASSARVVMSSAVGGEKVELGDVLSILDHQTQAERFDRHMLQSMLENISQGVSVVDQDQRLVAWNSAYVDMFDYPADMVRIGEPIANLIQHNIKSGWIRDRDPEHEARRRIAHMRAGKPHRYERQNPDGRYLRIVGSPMPGGGYVSTFTDITEDKRREQALLEANETLERRVRDRTAALERMADDLDLARRDAEAANASKTRFLAAASHDLLQPLNAARLFIGALDSSADEKTAALLDKTDRSIQSADELLKGLLDISRLDHGDVAAHPTRLPLGPLLEDLVDEARPMAQAAGLSLRLAPTSLAVDADPDFLQSILRNFISNARRYTREGGIVVGARRRGDQARIEVWDTGPGVPPEKVERLFDEFQRFEDNDNQGLRGAGLGLSISRRLADLMGAEIAVSSAPGSGSVFSISVPLAEPSAPHLARGAPSRGRESQQDLSAARVLCVDDEAAILDSMRFLLSGWGCQVDVASRVEDALSQCRPGRYDAVIADLRLHEREAGAELLKAVASALPSPANIALLTAAPTREAEAIVAELGGELLHKPVSPRAIAVFLAACLARTRPAGQAAE